MRQINNFEREILRRIIGYNNAGTITNLASVIDPQLSNKDIYLDYDSGTAEIRADIQFYNQGSLVNEIRRLTFEIVMIVNLLRDLQDNGYLTLFLEAPLPNNIRYGQLIGGNEYVIATIVDPLVTTLLLDYSFRYILVGQSLIDFVNNEFRSVEKVQADNAEIQSAKDSAINKRNLGIAVVAIIIATILSVWEIYNGTQEVKYGKMQVEQEQNVKLNITQQNSIENKLEENKKSLEEIKSVLRELKQLQTEKGKLKNKVATDKIK
ncbi:MAG: hypothetical protein WC139_00955 [Candidatus Kapaibacterium sp.]